MNWKRIEAGKYIAGPYTVVRELRSWWNAHGPGVEGQESASKVTLQSYCFSIALARASQGTTCTPVIGDIVVTLNDGRKGQISSTQIGAKHIRGENQPLYCIKFARGKRLCLFRDEFAVVVP